jgi:NADPH2:quinone reductase
MSTDNRTYTTSYEGLLGRGKAKAGEWVLVHAGAGGVGLAACQIAKAIGCKVIATASTEEKRDVCKEKAGVDAAVDYTKDGWQVSPYPIYVWSGTDEAERGHEDNRWKRGGCGL